MVIIGLLLIALICLVFGLIMQSAVWLVASLIATAGAGYLLYKLRDVIAAPKHAPPSEGLPPDAAGAAPPTSEIPADTIDEQDADDVWVIDGRPRYHLGDCAIIKGQDAEPIPYEQATEDGFMPCSLCEPHAAHAR